MSPEMQISNSLVNEEELFEAPKNTLSNKLGKLLAKGKAEERQKIIVDFFKILKSGEGYEKLFPTWPKMTDEKKQSFVDAGKKFNVNRGRAKEYVQQILASTNPQEIERGAEEILDDVETQTGVDMDVQAPEATENPSDDQPVENDPEVVDPNSEVLQKIRATYNVFINDFYDKTKVRDLDDQSKIVNALLKSLIEFATVEQKASALGRASDNKQPAKRDDLREIEVAPKSIRIFKTRIRNFQRALRASEQYIQLYQAKLSANKKMVQGERDKLVKIAEKTQQTIVGLNNAINRILGIAKKQPEQINEATASEKYMSMLDEIESVHDKLSSGKMLQIMNNLNPTNPVEMVWDEIKPVIKNTLEELNKIKKYFPQIVPFEGSEVESKDLLDKYQEAIRKIDLDASDIQSLPDEITDDDGDAILVNFQTKLISLSSDLQKIFGVKGLEYNKDSAEAKDVSPESPEGDQPDQDPESGESPGEPPEQQKQEKVVSTEADLQKFFTPAFISKIKGKLPDIKDEVIDAFSKFFVLYYNKDENIIPDEEETNDGFSHKLGVNSTIVRTPYFRRKVSKDLLVKMKRTQTLKDEAELLEKWIVEAKPDDIKRLVEAFIVQWKRMGKPKFNVDVKRIGKMQASKSFEGAKEDPRRGWTAMEEKLLRALAPMLKQQLRGK